MENIIKAVKKNWSYLAGGLLGGVGGFLYWSYVGCTTGTCPITSSPFMSIVFGALMGGIILNSIFGHKENKQQ